VALSCGVHIVFANTIIYRLGEELIIKLFSLLPAVVRLCLSDIKNIEMLFISVFLMPK
jgi:hypothetical protein